MDRREFLAASAGVASVSLAGCTALTDEIALGTPTEHHDDQSIRFVYEHDNEAFVDVNFNTRPDTPWKAVNRQPDSAAAHRLRIRMTPLGNATLDTYRFQFESTDDAAANFYLHPPEVGHEETFETYRDGDLSVIEAGYGDGTTVTTGFELLVHTEMDGGESPSVRADYEITLSGDGFLGDTYVATDQTSIELETADN